MEKILGLRIERENVRPTSSYLDDEAVARNSKLVALIKYCGIFTFHARDPCRRRAWSLPGSRLSMTKQIENPQTGIVKGDPKTAGNQREFTDGSTRAYAALHTAAIGLGMYKPGWRWSLHVGPQTGKDSENHIGYVLSGRMMVKDPWGNEAEIESGCAFEIVPGSDAWVIGDEPCIALDFTPTHEHST